MTKPTKYELVGYLSGLISILDSKDDAGGITRGTVLPREYERAYQQLRDILDKEQEDEARQRADDSVRDEAGAEGDLDRSGLRRPVGQPRGNSPRS